MRALGVLLQAKDNRFNAHASAVVPWKDGLSGPCRRADGPEGRLPAREEEDLPELNLGGLAEEGG